MSLKCSLWSAFQIVSKTPVFRKEIGVLLKQAMPVNFVTPGHAGHPGLPACTEAYCVRYDSRDCQRIKRGNCLWTGKKSAMESAESCFARRMLRWRRRLFPYCCSPLSGEPPDRKRRSRFLLRGRKGFPLYFPQGPSFLFLPGRASPYRTWPA